MKQELGILSSKGIFFHQATDFARKNLHYIHHGAEYDCDYPYEVDRDYVDSFLFFHILEGELEFSYLGEDFTAREGSMVLLDCKNHNLYYAKKKVKTRWFHFSGGLSQQLCDKIYTTLGCHFTQNIQNLGIIFGDIFSALKDDKVDDFNMSGLIHQLMCTLLSTEISKTISETILGSINYMQENYAQTLQVKELADMAHISLYHFSRRFKKETGIPPHEYLLNIRLGSAKRMLVETEKSVEEIGILCGFNSGSHFVRTFQKNSNTTPLQFRKMKL